MLRVALTGGAASGKSAAAAMLRELGAFVSQSDEIGRAMMEPGQAVYLGIVAHFGNGVLQTDGALNRRELARLAFREGRVQELNAIVHPPVIAAQAAWLQRIAAAHPTAVAVVESALVLETTFGAAADIAEQGSADGMPPLPWRSRFDRIVVVSAPESMRVERYVCRVLASDQSASRVAAEADARARFAAQMPELQKRALADIVIENDGSLSLLHARIGRLYEQLRHEAQDTAGEAM